MSGAQTLPPVKRNAAQMRASGVVGEGTPLAEKRGQISLISVPNVEVEELFGFSSTREPGW